MNTNKIKAKELFAFGKSKSEISRVLNVPRTTVRRWLSDVERSDSLSSASVSRNAQDFNTWYDNQIDAAEFPKTEYEFTELAYLSNNSLLSSDRLSARSKLIRFFDKGILGAYWFDPFKSPRFSHGDIVVKRPKNILNHPEQTDIVDSFSILSVRPSSNNTHINCYARPAPYQEGYCFSTQGFEFVYDCKSNSDGRITEIPEYYLDKPRGGNEANGIETLLKFKNAFKSIEFTLDLNTTECYVITYFTRSMTGKASSGAINIVPFGGYTEVTTKDVIELIAVMSNGEEYKMKTGLGNLITPVQVVRDFIRNVCNEERIKIPDLINSVFQEAHTRSTIARNNRGNLQQWYSSLNVIFERSVFYGNTNVGYQKIQRLASTARRMKAGT